MKRSKIVLAVGILAIAGGVLIIRTSSVHESQNPSAEVLIPRLKVEATTTTSPLLDDPPAVVPTAAAIVPNPSNSVAGAAKEFEAKKELEDFRILNKKVFLSEPEKQRKARLLQDPSFIAQLQNLFKVPNEYAERDLQQNAAVDFLLEAVKADPRSPAAEVLRSIVADPSTESESVSMTDRQNLAGVKAEVLYQWTAQDPERISEMEQLLPGPVSQKIWQNVLAQQEMNRAESAVTK